MSTLTEEIRPLLVFLTQTAEIYEETKAEIAKSETGIADELQQIAKNEYRVASAQQGTSASRLFYANTLQQGHADLLSAHQLAKQLLEAHLQAVVSHYVAVENDLKAKILEVSGGDQLLFALHVPVRPAGI